MKKHYFFFTLIMLFLAIVMSGGIAYSAAIPVLPPSAIIKSFPVSGRVIDPKELPLTVVFDGTSSTDGDAADIIGENCPIGNQCIRRYSWSVSGGAICSGSLNSPTIKCRLPKPGNYPVRLDVEDDEQQTGYREITYEIKTCPPPPDYAPRSNWPNNLSSKPENCIVVCRRSWVSGIWGVDEAVCVHSDGSFDYIEGPWPPTIVFPPYYPGYDWQKGCRIKLCNRSDSKPCCYQECTGGGGANFPPPPTYLPPRIGAGWVPPNTSGCLNQATAGTGGRDYEWWLTDCLMKAGVQIPRECVSTPIKFSLLQNNSFEAGLTPWMRWGNSSPCQISSEKAQNGAKSLKCAGNSAWKNYYQLSSLSLVTGSRYEFKGYLFADNSWSGSGAVGIYVWKSNNNWRSWGSAGRALLTTADRGNWILKKITFTAERGYSYRLSIDMNRLVTIGNFYFDNFSLGSLGTASSSLERKGLLASIKNQLANISAVISRPIKQIINWIIK